MDMNWLAPEKRGMYDEQRLQQSRESLAGFLQEQGIKRRWAIIYMFFFVMIAFSLPMLLAHETLLMSASVGCLWAVGVAGAFQSKGIKQIHYTFAFMAIVLALAVVWFELNQPYMVVAFVVFAVLFSLFGKKKIWWIEVGALVVIYFAFWL